MQAYREVQPVWLLEDTRWRLLAAMLLMSDSREE